MSGMSLPLGCTGVGGAAVSIAILQDQKSNTNNGGTFTSGSKQTRDLNTEVADPDNIVSLFSNRFTLIAGKYYIEAHGDALNVSQNRMYIENITDATTVARGGNTESSSNNSSSNAYVFGYVDISVSKAFEIQHECTTTRSTFGFGQDCSFGDDEVYLTVIIWKIG